MTPGTAPTRARRPIHFFLGAICLTLAVFWLYAIFFYSPDKRNVVGDKSWSEWAQSECAKTVEKRNKLADYTKLDGTKEALIKRAQLVEQATNDLENLIKTLRTRTPSDPKGAAIVPKWLTDYDTYINDRLDYVATLRQGQNKVFAETAVEGVPISERLTTFATDNAMDDCAPPTDVAG